MIEIVVGILGVDLNVNFFIVPLFAAAVEVFKENINRAQNGIRLGVVFSMIQIVAVVRFCGREILIEISPRR